VSLLGHILGWDYDAAELDRRASEQEAKWANCARKSEIDERIQRLEQGESLDESEQAS
jgi:hypothetical protein